MDDALIFSNDINELQEIKKRIEEKLITERLQIHPHKNQINRVKRGVNFLGFRFYQNQIRLQNCNLVRLKQKLKLRAKQKLPLSQQLLSINGHLGFIFAGNTAKIVERVFDERVFQYENKEYRFTLERL